MKISMIALAWLQHTNNSNLKQDKVYNGPLHILFDEN